jgi:hypothetical protein
MIDWVVVGRLPAALVTDPLTGIPDPWDIGTRGRCIMTPQLELASAKATVEGRG